VPAIACDLERLGRIESLTADIPYQLPMGPLSSCSVEVYLNQSRAYWRGWLFLVPLRNQGRLPLFPGPVTCDFREPKVNSYWLNFKAVGRHHGLHKVEVIPILMIISRAHQADLHLLFSPFLFRPLPKSKMVKIAVAGGSGRTSQHSKHNNKPP
jgi:hypothetical protein